MIERKFVAQKIKELQIQEYVKKTLSKVGLSYTKLQRTPLGEKIIICASRPGLVVGKSGANITQLTKDLKEKFNLENPQIELAEVENIQLDANIVAENIANALERFGSARFKGIGHKAMGDVMTAGALGVEITISGKIPSSRAKSWRFYQGYLKKCGDVALTGVDEAYAIAQLKTGIIGVQVRIMPPTTHLPDEIAFKKEESQATEETEEKKEKQEAKKEDKEKNKEQSKEQEKTKEKSASEKRKSQPKKRSKKQKEEESNKK